MYAHAIKLTNIFNILAIFFPQFDYEKSVISNINSRIKNLILLFLGIVFTRFVYFRYTELNDIEKNLPMLGEC